MQTISAESWIEFRDALSKLNNYAASRMTAWINKRGGIDQVSIESVIDYAYGLATKYGEASGTLAAMYYDAVATLERANVPAAEVAATATYGEVAKDIYGATSFSKDPDYIGNVVGRLTKQAGADTILQNAERDRAQFAWIPSGETCAFCIGLAANGWQNIGKRTLRRGKHAEHIHSNCDCMYAVRFNQETQVEGYDPDKYWEDLNKAARKQGVFEEWLDPTDKFFDEDANIDNIPHKNMNKDVINAMRKENYAKNREKIRAQKRDAYAERTAEELDV